MKKDFDGDEYLSQRSGRYEYRAVRYRKTCDFLMSNNLTDEDTLVDVGAGWTEFDYCLRREYNWMGRYMPLDIGIFQIDLNDWNPYKKVDHYVALEIIEHLYEPKVIIEKMLESSHKTVSISVPDPETVDVLAIDETHISIPDVKLFESFGFKVSSEKFYGGVYSNGENDALFATYAH